MSEVAKDRLLAVGARFASYEHENATKRNPQQINHESLHQNIYDTNQSQQDLTQQQSASGKVPFWKKTSGKVPGRYGFGFIFCGDFSDAETCFGLDFSVFA